MNLEIIGKKATSIRTSFLLYGLSVAIILKITAALVCISILSDAPGSYHGTLLADIVLSEDDHTLALSVSKEYSPVAGMLTRGQVVNMSFAGVPGPPITGRVTAKSGDEIKLDIGENTSGIPRRGNLDIINLSFRYGHNNIIKRCVDKILNRRAQL